MTVPLGRPSRLSGKVVLVTGAGRGLGRVIALRCAAEGADVVLTGRSRPSLDQVAEEVGRTGRRAAVAELDLRDEQSISAGVAEAQAAFGGIDVLVANSGVAGPTAPIWDVSTTEWADTFAVNVTGTFLCLRELLPGMVDRGGGSVVVIGSMTGKRPLANRSPYAASKMALVGMVRTAASDAGPYGVRINLISPGPVAGERLERVVANLAAAEGLPEEEALARLSRDAPLPRLVRPEDVAAAVTFLASEDAASITGEDLNVSAGTVTY